MSKKPELSEEELSRQANAIAEKYGLSASIEPDIRAVAVRGDNREYFPVATLRGPFPGWEVMAEVSTEITNKLDISHVMYEMAKAGP